MGPNPTKAQVDAVAKALLATVPEPPRRRVLGQCQIGGLSYEITGFSINYQVGNIEGPHLPEASHLTTWKQAMKDLAEPAAAEPFNLPRFLQPLPKTELDRLMEAALRMGEQRARRRADGCTCPATQPGKARTFDLYCPDAGHRRLAMAARHRRC